MFDNELLELEVRLSSDLLEVLQKKYPQRNIQKVHYSLGPSAKDMSYEELKAHIIEFEEMATKQSQEWNSKSEQEKLLDYLNQTVSALRKILKLTQMNLSDHQNLEHLQKMRSKIFGQAEGTLIRLNDTETFSLRNIDA